MKRNRVLMTAAIAQILFLCACSSSSQKENVKETAKKEDVPVSAVETPAEKTPVPEDRKAAVIYGTTYIIPKDFLVEDNGDNTTTIYFQSEKTDPVTDKIVITLLPDVWDGGTEYADSEKCIEELKKSMNYQFDKFGGWTKYDKEETAGAECDGDEGYYYRINYLFMNSYTDAVEITYSHLHDHGTDIQSSLVKEIIDSMEFSYSGFTKEEKNKQNADKKDNSKKYAKETKAVEIYTWCQEKLDADKKLSLEEVLKEAAKEFKMSERSVEKMYETGKDFASEGN